MTSLILITMDNGKGHCAYWQSCKVPNQTHRGMEKNWKMYAIKQIKICAEYRDMLPRPRLDLSGTPGLRPIGLSQGSWHTSLGLGSMSRYSAQILICMIYIYRYIIYIYIVLIWFLWNLWAHPRAPGVGFWAVAFSFYCKIGQHKHNVTKRDNSAYLTGRGATAIWVLCKVLSRYSRYEIPIHLFWTYSLGEMDIRGLRDQVLVNYDFKMAA